VLVFVWKSNKLGLYAGAIARAYALYLAVVEWRVWKTLAQAFVNGVVGIGNPAGKLGEGRGIRRIRRTPNRRRLEG
jgi:hypothetical protein